MRKNNSITHIKSKDIPSVQQCLPFNEVDHLPQTHSIHHISVVDSKQRTGIVTGTDLNRFQSKQF